MSTALRGIAPCCAVVILCLLAPRVPSLAHHGGGVEYDMSQSLGPLTGQVVEFAFRFPHPQIYIDVSDEHGNVGRWAMVMQPTPTALRRVHGWTNDSIRPGDTLAVVYAPHRTAENVGFARRIEVNGEFLYEQ
jgi:hypothetical protein